jgi:hypothetical protein
MAAPPITNITATNDIEETTPPAIPGALSMPSMANESYNLESSSYNERIEEQARTDLNNVLDLNHSHSVSSESIVNTTTQPNNTSVTQYLKTQQETMLEMHHTLNSLSARLQQVKDTRTAVDTTMLTTIKETFQESMQEMERATIKRFGQQIPQMVTSRSRNPHLQEDDASSFTSHLSGTSLHHTSSIKARRQVNPEPSLSSSSSRSVGHSSRGTTSTTTAPNPPEDCEISAPIQ